MRRDERSTHTLDECHRLLDRIIATVEPLIRAHVEAGGADPHAAGAEAQRRLGNALWDIFSRNHSVRDADGVYSLGTFRSSGDEIAEALMRLDPDARYEYLDFYMGSSASGVDLGHEYREIFRQLRAEGCDWTYYAEPGTKARNPPLPGVVLAYREVYGRLPEGWPHWHPGLPPAF